MPASPDEAGNATPPGFDRSLCCGRLPKLRASGSWAQAHGGFYPRRQKAPWGSQSWLPRIEASRKMAESLN